MGHHHHHDHDDHMPKLPKTLGQVLFILIVALLAGVSFFVYQKLIPMADYVSAQEDASRIRKVCLRDRKDSLSQEELMVWKEQKCPCIAKAMSEEFGKDIKSWIKESSKEERMAQYASYNASCKD